MSLFFTAEQWQGEIENCEPDKCAGWKWVPIDNLPDNTVSYARKAMLELRAGKRVGLFGWEEG